MMSTMSAKPSSAAMPQCARVNGASSGDAIGAHGAALSPPTAVVFGSTPIVTHALPVQNA